MDIDSCFCFSNKINAYLVVAWYIPHILMMFGVGRPKGRLAP